MTLSEGPTAYDELRAAAADARMILERVGGGGGVLDQLTAGHWTLQMSEAAATDLTSLIRALAEHARDVRADGGSLGSMSEPVVSSPPMIEMLDSALPLNRKERFYTGTVLPMIVASDGFAHLDRFLAACGVDASVDRSRDGNQRLQFFTEYSFVESVFTDRDRARFPETPEDNDTPDVVLVGEDWMLAVEAKMFHNPSVVSLDGQMQRQRRIIDYVAGVLNLPRDRVWHVLLLPAGLPADNVGAPVVTWEQVLHAYQNVGPRYWVNVLAEALQRYDSLVSRGPAFGQYRDATLTGAEIVDQFLAGALIYRYMGRNRGLDGSDLARDIAEQSWRTRTYEVRFEPITSHNWFPIGDFVERVQATNPEV